MFVFSGGVSYACGLSSSSFLEGEGCRVVVRFMIFEALRRCDSETLPVFGGQEMFHFVGKASDPNSTFLEVVTICMRQVCSQNHLYRTILHLQG